jgi:4-amino-4-deoxy-L-arabinose transferase-like glycosyltransferase
MLKKQNLYFITIIIIVTLLSIWKIGQHNLQEWDEARNGVNAFEMLHNKDFVNYYYNNEPDTWNAKPPLMIWSIVISYKIFGFNEFGLRFPSLICTVIFFVFCFKIIELLGDRFKAFLCCLILISSKAVLGNHIGLTGDFDSLLLLLLTASVYYFILYFEYKKNYAIYLVAILTGLAFYTKGTASFIFIPGFIAYILIRGKWLEFNKDKRIWYSMLLFILIVSSWILLVYSFGKSTTHSFYGSKNSIETMLVHDTFNRLTSINFEKINDHDNFFFFEVIDARLNLWNYLFYLSMLLGLYTLVKNKNNLKTYIQSNANRLMLLSFCLIMPLAITLSFAINQHNWYMAPIFMFIALITVQAINYICDKWKHFYFIIIIMFAFTFIRQIIYLYSLPVNSHYALSANKNLQNQTIIITNQLKQNIFLYLEWLNMSIIKIDNIKDIEKFKGQIILLNRDKINNTLIKNIEHLNYFDDYCLAKIKC